MYSIKKITVCCREHSPVVRVFYEGVRVYYEASVVIPMRPLYGFMEPVEAEAIYNLKINADSS